MDDIKLWTKREPDTDSLTHIDRIFRNNIKMSPNKVKAVKWPQSGFQGQLHSEQAAFYAY